ncbi:MAG: hypothetical protein Q8Q48_00575 [Candidatus Staskawiczbacteria bacterium]|nr:hypothetical protein [Candidatus Staskawiczbacteria bacterium]
MFFNKTKPTKIFEWKRGEKTPVNQFLMSVGESCGITEEVVFDRRQKSASINDTLWSICNEYLLKSKQAGNSDNVRALYFLMERILVEEGKSANHIVKKRLMIDLLRHKKSGMNMVIIVVPLEDSCEVCKRLDGKEFHIDEAIQKQPLPPDDCTCLRCACSY